MCSLVHRRVSAHEIRQSASIDDPSIAASTPPPQKAASRMSAHEPLEFLERAAMGLGLEDVINGSHGKSAKHKVSSPVASMKPQQFLENAAEGLLSENEKELRELLGDEFDTIDLDEQRRLLEMYTKQDDAEESDDSDEKRPELEATLDDSMTDSSDELDPKHAHWFQSAIPRYVQLWVIQLRAEPLFCRPCCLALLAI